MAASTSTDPVADTVVESRADVAPRLRTLLLTDLCNSTELVEKLGDARSAELFQATTGWCWNCSSAGARA